MKEKYIFIVLKTYKTEQAAQKYLEKQFPGVEGVEVRKIVKPITGEIDWVVAGVA